MTTPLIDGIATKLDEIDAGLDDGRLDPLPPAFCRGFIFERWCPDARPVVSVVARELRIPRTGDQTHHVDHYRGGAQWTPDPEFRLLAYCVVILDKLLADPLVYYDGLGADVREALGRFGLPSLTRIADAFGLRKMPLKEPPKTLGEVEPAMREAIAFALSGRLLDAAKRPPASRPKPKRKTHHRDRNEQRASRQSGGRLGLS